MQKKALRKLRRLPATDAMIKKAGETVLYQRCYYGNMEAVRRSKYGALLRMQCLSGFIKIAVFLPDELLEGIRTPRYEIFVNQKGDEWITRELDRDGNEVRWLTAMFDNLPGIMEIYRRDQDVYLNADARKTLASLPLKGKKQEITERRLTLWQKEKREEDIARKEELEQKPWDEDMALVPEILQGFTEWMRRDVVKEYFVFYEYDPKGQTKGFCSRCQKFVQIKNPRHNKETRCPACGAEAVFKADTKSRTIITQQYYAEAIQRIQGGIVIRRFTQMQSYRGRDYWEPYVSMRENQRCLIFDDGTVRSYDFLQYKNKFLRWCPSGGTWSASYYWSRRIPLYKRNLPRLQKTTMLKRSTIGMWDVLPLPAADYLRLEKERPVVEMLARIGMFRLAGDLAGRNHSETADESETELAKKLKLDNSRLKRLREMDGNITTLRWLQLEKMANTIWPDGMILDFGQQDIPPSDLYFLKNPVNYVKTYNYLVKQADLTTETIRQTLITWRDYLTMAEQMKMDVTKSQIERPKNVKEAHDRLILLQKKGTMEKEAKEIEKKWPKVNRQLKKLKKFEFTDETYCIKAPEAVYDIVKEGEILSHCVHRCDYYFGRITSDESYLFFLRKCSSPDSPWYTLEVEPSGNIRQKRTTGDNQNPDFQAAVPFLVKWQQYFKKQLTKNEKKLGEKSDELRRTNYKKLREDGKTVWHGKLAGQLLADVLEKDFMEAM